MKATDLAGYHRVGVQKKKKKPAHITATAQLPYTEKSFNQCQAGQLLFVHIPGAWSLYNTHHCALGSHFA